MGEIQSQDNVRLRRGEHRFWMCIFLLSLLMVLCTYLNPFFFERLSLKSFSIYSRGLGDWSFSPARFWKSSVVPHCLFSGFCGAMFFEMQAENASIWKRSTKVFGWLIVCFLYFFLLEMTQVFIPGRTVSGGDILNHTIALFSGVFVGGCFQYSLGHMGEARRFAAKCVGLWLLVLTYLSLYPLSIQSAQKFSLIERFLKSLREPTGISDLVSNLLLGFPIAWILLDALQTPNTSGQSNADNNQTWFNRWNEISSAKRIRDVSLILSVVVGCGMFVETLQYFFSQRFPSLTDIIFQMLGALVAAVIFFVYRFDRFRSERAILLYLGHRTSADLICILGVLGFLVFEWTTWVPSIEISSLRVGVRELIMPLTQEDYPWDLHWQSYPISVISIYCCSILTGLAMWKLALPFYNRQEHALRNWLDCASFGVLVQLGKVAITDKLATPLLVLSSVFGALTAWLLILTYNYLLIYKSELASLHPRKDAGS